MLELQTLAFNGRKSEVQSLHGWESDSVGLNHFVTALPAEKPAVRRAGIVIKEAIHK